MIDTLHLSEPSIGDSRMLPQFFELCARFSTGRFLFTAPFYDKRFIRRLLACLSPSNIRFEVIVKSDVAAAEIGRYFRDCGCQDVQIYVAEALHAKVYLFESPRNELFGLIGSYNPTNAATNNNVEIGVFLASRPRTPEWKNLFELRTFLKNSARPVNISVRGSN